tara:strand:- start:122 stop:370 length:249 start_codon:yes stop_codon:yes gene_type:complete
LNIQTRVVHYNLKGEEVGKASQAKSDERYGYKPLSRESKPRLDVNNLLNRIKIEKNQSKKTNLFILTGSAFVVSAVVLLFSI